jgi:hypothetical protein
MFKGSRNEDVTHVARSIGKHQVTGFQQLKNLLFLCIGKDNNMR